LGWVLLEQGLYKEAEKELRLAVYLDEKIPEKQLGGGMAYCLLPEAAMKGRKPQRKGKPPVDNEKEKEEEKEWEKKCKSSARPETIDQYKWFIEKGKRELAEKIKTSGVVNTESQPSTQP